MAVTGLQSWKILDHQKRINMGTLQGGNCRKCGTHYSNSMRLAEHEDICNSTKINDDLIMQSNLLKKFCTNEILHFGSEDSGIEVIATKFEDENEFLDAFKKTVDGCEDYTEDDIATIDIYFSKENETAWGTGFFGKAPSGELPNDAIYIGQFFGTEY